jgi:hypothetical protein
MKSRIFVSLLLALVMLVTLATPALAGKPAKGGLYAWDFGPVGPEIGSVSLQRTHDNHIKVSLVFKGATPSQQYYVRLSNGGAWWDDSNVYANSRGVLRVKLTSTAPMGFTTMSIVVDEAPYDTTWDFGTYAIEVPLN